MRFDEAKWETTPGGVVKAKLAVSARAELKEALSLAPVGLPDGVTAKFTMAEDKKSAELELTVGEKTAPGTYDFVVSGKPLIVYRNNPEAAARAGEDQARIAKLVEGFKSKREQLVAAAGAAADANSPEIKQLDEQTRARRCGTQRGHRARDQTGRGGTTGRAAFLCCVQRGHAPRQRKAERMNFAGQLRIGLTLALAGVLGVLTTFRAIADSPEDANQPIAIELPPAERASRLRGRYAAAAAAQLFGLPQREHGRRRMSCWKRPHCLRTERDGGALVVPGEPEASRLLKVAAHRDEPHMPPADNDVGAVALTPAELGLLQRWIEQGAKDSQAAGRTPIQLATGAR